VESGRIVLEASQCRVKQLLVLEALTVSSEADARPEASQCRVKPSMALQASSAAPRTPHALATQPRCVFIGRFTESESVEQEVRLEALDPQKPLWVTNQPDQQ
jgi:hypothetical protein